MTVNQVIAWNMARWRKAAGLTQAELGERLGWTHTAVSAAERSWDGERKREFDGDLIVALSSALGVPLLALFLPPGDGPGMAELFGSVLPESAAESPVLDAYRKALADCADRFMKPGEGGGLAEYLRGMASAEYRGQRLTRGRLEDLRALEREYRRRLRGALTQQVADLQAALDRLDGNDG